jgi:urease accessory protein
MLTLTQRLPADPTAAVSWTLTLTADERSRSRHAFNADDGQPLYLHLPRGTVLQHGDLLKVEDGDRLARIIAKPEAVMTVKGHSTLELLRAAYHLGNRHVALEVTEHYLRLLPDDVLKTMLEHMGLHVHEEIVPFQPEAGAYGHVHAH